MYEDRDLTEAQAKALDKSKDRISKRDKKLPKFKPDTSVGRGWCSKNITSFGDCGDSIYE